MMAAGASRRGVVVLGAVVGLLAGCHSAPPSQFPSGQAALDRMKATYECAHGLKAAAKLDHKAGLARLRGDLSFFAIEPATARMSVFSPFGLELATLTSDGRRFAFTDVAQKRFLEGPASACNIARLTQVPVPVHALVSLLQGRAPLLVHQPGEVSLDWSWWNGAYIVKIPSSNGAEQEVRMVPHPDDFKKPWSEQRLRVKEVRVSQKGVELYRAKLSDHAPAKAGEPLIDEEGIDPPIQPIAPACDAEVPRRIQVEVPVKGDDVRFQYQEATMNPPVPEGIFVQQQPGGTQRISVGECDQGW